MTFSPEKVNEFIQIFNTSKEKIAAFGGCQHVELLNDINTPNIFFTKSNWESQEHLENYRNSEFFKNTWSKTKVLFSDKPEAWSVVRK